MFASGLARGASPPTIRSCLVRVVAMPGPALASRAEVSQWVGMPAVFARSGREPKAISFGPATRVISWRNFGRPPRYASGHGLPRCARRSRRRRLRLAGDGRCRGVPPQRPPFIGERGRAAPKPCGCFAGWRERWGVPGRCPALPRERLRFSRRSGHGCTKLMPLLLRQHPLGQETVVPQRSIRIEVFATNWAAYRRVRRADSRGARALLLSTQDSGAPLQRLPPVARTGAPRWSGSQCDPPGSCCWEGATAHRRTRSRNQKDTLQKPSSVECPLHVCAEAAVRQSLNSKWSPRSLRAQTVLNKS